ncbi:MULTISPECIES: transporter substrate-binding domain-containing protein [unclassified Pseudoalteromonas]|uniref:substrate-binding periplasmic protein n=1 Tax=unclassified Pseudoalteromonas TaxID=194690 RepID=UPI002096ACB4|nr:transporter substrate-binding domain-containing protein [Pseudoalteromonas sp. XMcav2-N]MCO7189007.1 transporter substrate-binding domain-containing protein [Pseudoalteromonas sp. XMcav2-N]
MHLLLSLVALYPLVAFSAAYDTPNLEWVTEDYPPFNYHINGEVEGLSIRILNSIYRDLGWTLDKRDIMLVPWPRAYRMAMTSPNTCIFSITYTRERAELFQFIGPSIDNQVAIIGHKENAYQVEDLSDLKNYKIGVVKNDIGHQLLRKSNIGQDNLVFLASGFELVQMLKLKRIDLIAYGDIIARFQFKRAGINPAHYRVILPLSRSYLGFACNKQVESQWVQSMNQALRRLRRNEPALFLPQSY